MKLKRYLLIILFSELLPFSVSAQTDTLSTGTDSSLVDLRELWFPHPGGRKKYCRHL
jgi:hypothetical protein